MPKGKHGFSSSITRRKDLKPKRRQTDAQLLASAQRSADAWQARLQRERNI